MSNFRGFDLSGVVEVRIHSYSVGTGGTAQLDALGLEVRRAGGDEAELVDVTFEGEGPALATAQSLVAAINRRLRERRAVEG